MSSFLASAEYWFMHMVLAGAALLLLAAILMLLCRQPIRRQRLAEAGLGAALVCGVLCFFPAWLSITVPELAYVREVKELPSPAETKDEVFESEQEGLVNFEEAGPGEILEPLRPGPVQRVDPAPKSSTVPAASVDIDWLAVAFTIYVIAALTCLARSLLGYVALGRYIRSAERPHPSAARLFWSMCGNRHARLLVSSQLELPMSCGAWRPTVVVPAKLCDDPERLRWIFAHELSHLERGDPWSCLMLALAQSLYFYVPWFWWLRRQLRLSQEYLADAAATETILTPEDYAEFLLGLVRGPRGPAHALGVLSHSSDLYRRIAMLLEKKIRVEKACPRWWSCVAGSTLLGMAVLVSGLGVNATAAPSGQDDGEKKAVPKREGKQTGLGGGFQHYGPARFTPYGFPFNGRLGVRLTLPSETLVEQLGLPEGHAFVIDDVVPHSPAAKAGVKAHDILLKLQGKPVSSNIEELTREVAEFKADVLVDLVVLRKGKEETIKGIKLPEAKMAGDPRAFPPPPRAGMGGGGPGFAPGQGFMLGGRGGEFGMGGGRFGGPAPASGAFGFVEGAPGAAPFGFMNSSNARNGIMTTIFRNDDHFTARHQEGSLVISVTGSAGEGKFAVSSIHVQDGKQNDSYESVHKVPEEYRDKVANLVEMTKTGNIKVELRTPEKPKKEKNKKEEPQAD